MLQNEAEPLVRLKEELDFVGMYVDLLQVRFADGFTVRREIDGQALMRSVVPCSIQLLIENAIKHNVWMSPPRSRSASRSRPIR